jgi:hypothetical protein
MLYFAGDGISTFLRDFPAGTAYNSAPTCPPQATTTDSGAPCRAWVDAVITAQWTEYHTARFGGDRYYLDLRLAGDRTETVELPDTNLPWGGMWNAVKVGDTVQAEVWQGQVAHVRAGTRTEPTATDPASRGLSSLPGCLCLAPYALMVIVIIVAALNLDRLTALAARRAPPKTKREHGS